MSLHNYDALISDKIVTYYLDILNNIRSKVTSLNLNSNFVNHTKTNINLKLGVKVLIIEADLSIKSKRCSIRESTSIMLSSFISSLDGVL